MKDPYCYPFIVGGLEATLRHVLLSGYPGISINDEQAYDQAIKKTIADIYEMSKEYSNK